MVSISYIHQSNFLPRSQTITTYLKNLIHIWHTPTTYAFCDIAWYITVVASMEEIWYKGFYLQQKERLQNCTFITLCHWPDGLKGFGLEHAESVKLVV